MAFVVHLSDLHMVENAAIQARLFEQLIHAVRVEREACAAERAALIVTGDVFDSATQAIEPAVRTFLALQSRLVDALGGDAPTIVLPGNHDRRRFGLLAPQHGELFQALRDAADPRRVYVAGCDTPFLAQIVPESLHRLPVHVIAYDSTYLPGGLIGAGGTIRLEDLLAAHARLPDDGKPLVVLMHHHLIPTPLTDVSRIDASGSHRLARWVVGTALPALVSYGDREELTMTALGAGTALSTLHAFGRAVLLLHGHKHVPTARLVAGMTSDCGDLLIASAGSAGTRERVHATRDPDAARLWPSFNRIELSGDDVRIEALSFSPKYGARPPMRRDLARVKRVGARWALEPVTFRVKDPAPRVDEEDATYVLSPALFSNERWDFTCERRVTRADVGGPGAALRRYVDFVHALPRVLASRSGRRANRRVELDVGGVTRYRVENGLARTLAEGARAYGAGTAFEWVGLLCRYGAAKATLRLARIEGEGFDPFASVTDLTTGRERPVRIVTTPEHWTVTAEHCSPRSLLRLYWPLGGNR